MKQCVVCFLLLLGFQTMKAQYKFSGRIDAENWQHEVYLSLVEDYRKTKGVYAEQIIAKVNTNAQGYFEFTGNQLDKENRIYRIHIDNCNANQQGVNHFTGHCKDSEEIIFIASNIDTIQLPLSGNQQMFCDIDATNKNASCFFKIDSLIEIMKFDYAEYPSNTSRKLNNKKWFYKIQQYGESLNEPLAELYIYNFLSDRTNNLHDYYLEDLGANKYYENLKLRLTKNYPNTPYSRQYETELNADLYTLHNQQENHFLSFNRLLYFLLFLAVGGNIWWYLKYKANQKQSTVNLQEQLTKQERSVLHLILQDKTNKEIAEALFVSVSTVKTHINSIYKKLGVTSREEVKILHNNKLKK